MRRLGDLSEAQLGDALCHEGLRFKVGPYVYSLQSQFASTRLGMQTLYTDFPLADPSGFADFHVALKPANLLQRLRRRTSFFLDDQRPFGSLQIPHAYAFLEWGMNWCISVCANEYLKLHSAVIARDGIAMIMPGLPGAGKSTLCAALGLSGWRVLSDEHAMIHLGTANVEPLYRPVSLKNDSIDVIRSRYPDAVMGPVTDDTHKGIVAHLKADLDPTSHDPGPVPARLMVFPEYRQGEKTLLRERTRAECFMFAAHHSFNYSILSDTGFDTMTALMDAVQCYELKYSNLDEALRALDDLAAQVARP
jgi:HprK-related kinase A